METVAKHLVSEALRRTAVDEIDLFGRTAFNRYYYASFWIVRNAVAQIDPKWFYLSHADVPKLLEGNFVRRFKKEFKKAEALGVPTHKWKAIVNNSASGLSNLMTTAYLLRVQADYKSDAQAIRDGKVIVLMDTQSSIAADWPHQARKFTAQFLYVARQINLI